ncbi:Flavonoid 3'-monooxygenase [Nymphaea thermarum]|nr:Flavonoid 3'-monooxygenase [Nymphaea thermarum]
MTEDLIASLIVLLAAACAVIWYFWRQNSRLPPGPSGWPLIGSLPALGAMPHHSIAELGKRYGPILSLRLGTTTVVAACSASAAREFLKHNDANFLSRPSNAVAKHMAYDSHDMVWAEYGPKWRSLRKICGVHLFSNKALEDFRLVREKEVGILAVSLARAGELGEIVGVGEALHLCIANVLGKVLIGRRMFEGEEDAGEFRRLVLEGMQLSGVFNIGDFVPSLEWMDLMGVAKKMKEHHRRHDGFMQKIMDKHAFSSLQGDFLSVLLRLKGDPDPVDLDGLDGKLTDIDIKALLSSRQARNRQITKPCFICLQHVIIITKDMFAAGTDTSTSTVEWAIAELIQRPHIQKKVQAELDSVVGRDRLVKESDIPNLTYLQAIVKESFRLHPSTSLSLQRITSESCQVAGYHIPKGTRLLVNVWSISRDPSIWTDPLEFQPERFMPGSKYDHIDVRGNDFEVIPFGAGRRICPGMSMGIKMVQLMVATLVHGFRWELPASETLNMDEAYGITLQRAMPLKIHPKPRLAPSAYHAHDLVLSYKHDV